MVVVVVVVRRRRKRRGTPELVVPEHDVVILDDIFLKGFIFVVPHPLLRQFPRHQNPRKGT